MRDAHTEDHVDRMEAMRSRRARTLGPAEAVSGQSRLGLPTRDRADSGSRVAERRLAPSSSARGKVSRLEEVGGGAIASVGDEADRADSAGSTSIGSGAPGEEGDRSREKRRLAAARRSRAERHPTRYKVAHRPG